MLNEIYLQSKQWFVWSNLPIRSNIKTRITQSGGRWRAEANSHPNMFTVIDQCLSSHPDLPMNVACKIPHAVANSRRANEDNYVHWTNSSAFCYNQNCSRSFLWNEMGCRDIHYQGDDYSPEAFVTHSLDECLDYPLIAALYYPVIRHQNVILMQELFGRMI